MKKNWLIIIIIGIIIIGLIVFVLVFLSFGKDFSYQIPGFNKPIYQYEVCENNGECRNILIENIVMPSDETFFVWN